MTRSSALIAQGHVAISRRTVKMANAISSARLEVLALALEIGKLREADDVPTCKSKKLVSNRVSRKKLRTLAR